MKSSLFVGSEDGQTVLPDCWDKEYASFLQIKLLQNLYQKSISRFVE